MLSRTCFMGREKIFIWIRGCIEGEEYIQSLLQGIRQVGSSAGRRILKKHERERVGAENASDGITYS
jgi:hypothetical protein